jgi:hypothetical protein
MRYIDPCLFASCRSMPELELLAAAGGMALVEPMTWRGLDRRFAESFLDDFERLIVAEARRALSLRLGYAACLGVPPQEARHGAIAARVIDLMPRFLGNDRVAGIGEIGLLAGGHAEETVFRLQVRLARHHGLPVVIRMPPRDGPVLVGRMMRILGEESVSPALVLFNGVDEDLAAMLRPTGCWLGLTVGSPGGMSVERAVLLLAHEGSDRMLAHSGAGREGGDLLAVPKLARHMLSLGFMPEQVERVIYHQPRGFFSQARPLALVDGGRPGKAPSAHDASERLRAS